MTAITSVNGALCAATDAKISVFDRGFLYGDSVYETLRTYRGQVHELDKHLRRLAHSAAGLNFELPFSRAVLAGDIEALLDQARADTPDGEWTVRLVVTRGSGPIGLDPALAVDPSRILIARPLAAPPIGAYRDGIRAALIAADDLPQKQVPAGIKTGDYRTNLVALDIARKRGAEEGIMLDENGCAVEGTTSNIWLVKDEVLVTPPVESGILEGITRGNVIAVAAETGTSLEVRPIPAAELLAADEVFITSTNREVLPVARIDERRIGPPGQLTRMLHAALRRRFGVAPLDFDAD